MYSQPEFAFMEIAARHQLLRELAAPQRCHSSLPLSARIAARAQTFSLRPQRPERPTHRPRLETPRAV